MRDAPSLMPKLRRKRCARPFREVKRYGEEIEQAAAQALAATDWKAIDAMTDKDIARQIAANRDAASDMAPEIDARAIRRATGMTQAEFAAAYRFSVRTVQKWERGAKSPSGPARTYYWYDHRHQCGQGLRSPSTTVRRSLRRGARNSPTSRGEKVTVASAGRRTRLESPRRPEATPTSAADATGSRSADVYERLSQARETFVCSQPVLEPNSFELLVRIRRVR